jgi:hypothetical protein
MRWRTHGYLICCHGAGEHGHRFFLKLINHLTNQKADWEETVFKIHSRDAAMKKLVREVSGKEQ